MEVEVVVWRLAITAVVVFLVWRGVYGLPRLHASGQRDVRARAIESLAIAVNCKDAITGDHVHRVRVYADVLGRLLNCTELELQALREGALLHDVGKIGVPDAVLLKPGKLTAQEFELMKAHTLIGYQMVRQLEFPYPLAELIRSHHERFDGQGYPFGLKGSDIPLTARILSVVDCFDAYQQARPYKPAFSRDQARALLVDGAGSQFDPAVVNVFLQNLDVMDRAVRVTPVGFDFLVPPVLPEKARACRPAAGLAELGAAAA